MSTRNQLPNHLLHPPSIQGGDAAAVGQWPLAHRLQENGFLAGLRTAACVLRDLLLMRSGGTRDTTIRVPPMSAEWLRERRFF